MKNLSKIILHTLKENCGQDNATPTSQKCTAIQLVVKQVVALHYQKKLAMYVPDYTQGVVIKNF